MLVSQSQIMINYQNCRKHYTSPAIVVRQIKSVVQRISYYSGYFIDITVSSWDLLTYVTCGKYTLQAKNVAHDSVVLKQLA